MFPPALLAVWLERIFPAIQELRTKIVASRILSDPPIVHLDLAMAAEVEAAREWDDNRQLVLKTTRSLQQAAVVGGPVTIASGTRRGVRFA